MQATGWDLLRECVETDDDTATAARCFLTKCGASKRTSDSVFPIIEWAAAHLRRSTGRRVEQSVFGGGSKRKTLGQVIDSIGDRKRLLEESFPLSDGTWVRWGEATVAQHKQRIAILTKHLAGVQDTIQRHESAVSLLDSAGVSCLDEIDGTESAA